MKGAMYLKKQKVLVFHTSLIKNDQQAAYPHKAVESVDGWEIKVQTEKVEWKNAD